MEKTIKYLENGEYHYATVKDVGDLAKLKTDSKDDLVTAINELFVTGGDAPKKPEGYDKLVDNVADAIQKQEQVAATITNMQQTSQLSDAEMAHMKQVQEELHQEYLKAVEELNKAVEKAKADAAALDKKTNDMQGKIDETFADVNKEVSDVHKQLDAESKGLHKDLDDTKTSLEATRKDLLNSTQEYDQVHSEVKDLQDKFNRRVWSTDLDPVREQVSKNSTEVQQTKDELKRKADQSNLDLVTNSIEDLNAKVKQNASGLEVAVKRDELGGDVSRLLGDKTNLLLGTRDFSGEDNWKNRDTVTIEPGYYKGLKSAAVQVLDGSIYQPYRVKADTAYTFSFFAREDEDNPKAKLAIKPINAENININNEEQVVHITTEWQRFAVTFSADKECDVSIQVIQGPEASNNVLHLAGLKLQYGQNNTPWEPNEADVAENIEKNESRFNAFSDQITGLVKKQEKMGDTERQLDTRITETAEGLQQTSKDLEDANGKITEFKGQLESTAKGLKTDYEKYTNEAVGQISDSSLNLIHNSAFSNQDDQFESWQNISAKATVREDSNNLHWVELTQSGQGTDNPIGVTSNYFIVKQGKVTVAVDVKLGDKANLDNQNILLLELYDESKKRVDFTDVSVSQLGLSMSVLNDHNVHRGLYRLGIDRKDVKYMTVKAILHRNGDLWLTNFSARLSSIDDGGYTPNPDDVNHQILKMNTKIEEDAEHIALKANSVDVTRDIKSAVQNSNGGGRNLLQGTSTASGDVAGVGGVFVKGAFNGYDAVKTNGAWSERYINLQSALGRTNAKAGDWYTISVYVKADKQIDTGYLAVFRALDNVWSSHLDSIQMQVKPITTQWQQYSWSFQINDITLQQQNTRFEYSQDTGDNWIYWAGWMLEKGTVATPWSPAPEDTSAEIKSAKDAAIKVASDQINIHVNELSTQFDDKLNKRVNEVKTASEKFTSDGIEQVVTKVTNVKNDVDRLGDTVNGIQVGGRNLLVGTSDDEKSGKAYAFADYQISGGLQPNKTYTLSGWARVDQNSLNHRQNVFIDAYSEDWSWAVSLGINASLDWQYNKITFTTPAGKQLHPYVTVYLSHPNGGTNENNNDAASGMAFIKKLKLEEGNIATDWTQAPEDINQSIKDATEYKTVTGTIDFNNLKTQQKIFYKDLQATNAPAGGNYWYYLDVEPGDSNSRIIQTAVSDRDNITWVRTFVDSWSPWIRQADQRNVDDLNNQINGFKTEVTASVKNLGDRVTTEVNSVTTKIKQNNGGGVNLLKRSSFRNTTLEELRKSWSITQYAWVNNKRSIVIDFKNGNGPVADITQDVEIEPNTDYVLSLHLIYAQMSPGKSFGFQTYLVEKDANGNPVGPYKDNGQMMANSDLRSANTRIIHTSNTTHKGTLYLRALPGTQVEFNDVKLERGNIATPWSDSPEDLAEFIGETNTKWDVANGQIQGKVTETQVNDILNGKGYATQSWAQTMFQMKKDSITLQAVRDNITNGIQNQVNRINNKIDTQTLDSADINNMRTQGHYFVRHLANSPISGWVYVDVTGNNNDRLKQDVYQDNGDEHRSRRWFGSFWTEWTTDVNNKNVVSQINITPDQIKIASHKIEIDGNTYIHGELNVPNVKLKGSNGIVDLSGDGINITKYNGAGINIANNGIQLTANTNGQNEIEGVITTAWNLDNKSQNGIGLILTTQQDLGRPYGGDILTIGTMPKSGLIHAAMVFDATGLTSDYKRGFNWMAPHYLSGAGGVLRFPGSQDDLLLCAGNVAGSRQSYFNQPTMRLVNGAAQGSAGLQFQWDDLVPFGRITSSMSYMSAVGTDGNDGLTVSWYSWPGWYGGRKVPSLVSTGSDGSRRNGGLAFYPGGEVCFWQGDFRSNFRWSGLHNEN